jgi:hypothetical protein
MFVDIFKMLLWLLIISLCAFLTGAIVAIVQYDNIMAVYRELLGWVK